MPRIVVNVPDGEAAHVAGIRVKALHVQGKGRRVRVVIDIPPGWPDRVAVIDRPQGEPERQDRHQRPRPDS
jgi:hypothetical protein